MLLLSAKKSQYLWICCVWQDAYGVYHVWQVHTHIYIDTQCLTRIRINTYMPYIRTRRAQGWSGLTGSSARGNTETAPQFSHVGQFWLGILDSSWFPILPTSAIAHFEGMWKCIFKCINLHADENVQEEEEEVQIHGGDIWQLDFLRNTGFAWLLIIHWCCCFLRTDVTASHSY